MGFPMLNFWIIPVHHFNPDRMKCVRLVDPHPQSVFEISGHSARNWVRHDFSLKSLVTYFQSPAKTQISTQWNWSGSFTSSRWQLLHLSVRLPATNTGTEPNQPDVVSTKPWTKHWNLVADCSYFYFSLLWNCLRTLTNWVLGGLWDGLVE